MQNRLPVDNWHNLFAPDLKRILLGLPPLGLIVRTVLNIGCNAHCVMCNGARYDPSNEFNYTSVMKILETLDSHTVSAISLFGGEPLLDKNGLFDIFKRCKKKGIKVLITTNGSLLDALFLDKIIHDGADEITFSLDALGKTHDSIRGMPGLSKHIEDMVCYIRNKHPSFRVKINTVIMKNNYKEIPRLIKWMDKMGVYSVTIHNLRNCNNNYKKLKVDYLKQILLFRKLTNTATKIEFIGYPSMNNKEEKCNYLLHHLNVLDNRKIIPCHYRDDNPFFLDRPIKYLYKMDEFKRYIFKKIMTCRKCLITDD
ncbi:MAG: radical SAM protein [Candidatus Omnitrophota bacterium]